MNRLREEVAVDGSGLAAVFQVEDFNVGDGREEVGDVVGGLLQIAAVAIHFVLMGGEFGLLHLLEVGRIAVSDGLGFGDESGEREGVCIAFCSDDKPREPVQFPGASRGGNFVGVPHVPCETSEGGGGSMTEVAGKGERVGGESPVLGGGGFDADEGVGKDAFVGRGLSFRIVEPQLREVHLLLCHQGFDGDIPLLMSGAEEGAVGNVAADADGNGNLVADGNAVCIEGLQLVVIDGGEEGCVKGGLLCLGGQYEHKG